MSTLQATNIKNASYGGVYNMQTGADGSVSFVGNATVAGAATVTNGATVGNFLIPPNAFYLKNRLINGSFTVSQRATTGTNNITVGTAGPTFNTGYTTVDRWFTLATTTSTAPSSAQITGSGGVKQLQITGAVGTTAVYVGQRIISANSFDLAGQTVTLSFTTSNSLLTTVNYQLAYATTTADNFGTLATPTKTVISPVSPGTGSVTVTGTLARYSVSFAVPSGAFTGLEVLFSVGAQTSGTWLLQDVQLEVGPAATPIERRPFPQELALCQSYYEKSFPYNVPIASNAGRQGAVNLPQLVAASTAQSALFRFPFVVTKRIAPVSVQFTAATTNVTVSAMNYGNLSPGVNLSGGGLAANTYIVSQTSGTTGGAGVYVVNTTNTIASTATATGQSAPIITFYNPEAANAQSRNVTVPVDNTLTLPAFVSDNGFSYSFTSGAGSAANQIVMVHYTSEIEVP